MLSWYFLVLSCVFAGLTANAYWPIRGVRLLLVPSFLCGWLTAELPLHHLAIQLVTTALFANAGALSHWPGWLGLALDLCSWVGLLHLASSARKASLVLDAALRDALGDALTKTPADGPPEAPILWWLWPFVSDHPEVRSHLHIRYAEGAGVRHLLDVYTPKRGCSNAPVVLQIHGGGWFTGHKRQQALPMLLSLASQGCVCVSINYRLSPRATWPEHLIDAKLALGFIREHIAEYGGDPACVIVTGGSAGGHLAAMVALTANDPRYQPGFEHVDTSVRGCVPLYGVYDFTDRHGHQLNSGLRRLVSAWVLKKLHSQDREAFEAASPMSLVRTDAPPFFVIQGATDNVVAVADARAFAQSLREISQNPVAYAEIPFGHHAFDIYHSTRTDAVVKAVARFVGWVHAAYLNDTRGTRAA